VPARTETVARPSIARWGRLAPPVAAMLYPFALARFHAAVTGVGGSHGLGGVAYPSLWLAIALAIPTYGLWQAIRLAAAPDSDGEWLRALRLAYLTVAAPTLFTFAGVVLFMAGASSLETWVWIAGWAVLVGWAMHTPESRAPPISVPDPARLRIVHGIAAVPLAIYVLFHLSNHLLGLVGPEVHAAVMNIGRRVYRAPLVEPLLVLLFLFEIGVGLRLAWRWSARPVDAFRAFQVASGVYLGIFVVGHMNSVFVFARAFLGIDTGWGFATGAPSGLIADAWNIRLVPHYALGVFFVLGHLASGLRIVLLAHGATRRVADRAWVAGLAMAGAIAVGILSGMCGVRLGS
jgi:hypothetical protein